jgi:hypothetical protein
MQQKEKVMDILGLILMWVWTAVIYIIWSRWAMGDESDRRRDYWAKYEGK